MIRGYITNLGKYVEGQLVGEWLAFPCARSRFLETLKNIGIGRQYEEFFISDWESDEIDDLDLGEYPNYDMVNYLAHQLQDCDTAKLSATVESLGNATAANVLGMIDALDDAVFYPDVDNDEDLGRMNIDDAELESMMGRLSIYFDYEAFGRDIRLSRGSHFSDEGYIDTTDMNYQEFPAADIPDEFIITRDT